MKLYIWMCYKFAFYLQKTIPEKSSKTSVVLEIISMFVGLTLTAAMLDFVAYLYSAHPLVSSELLRCVRQYCGPVAAVGNFVHIAAVMLADQSRWGTSHMDKDLSWIVLVLVFKQNFHIYSTFVSFKYSYCFICKHCQLCLHSHYITAYKSLWVDFRLQNDLYCVGWGVKLYSLSLWVDSIMIKSSRIAIKISKFSSQPPRGWLCRWASCSCTCVSCHQAVYDLYCVGWGVKLYSLTHFGTGVNKTYLLVSAWGVKN